VSVETFNSYRSRFYTLPSGEDEAKVETALRRATQYLDAKYGTMWKGYRSTKEQALDWPRTVTTAYSAYFGYPASIGVEYFAIDEIPAQLVIAACEAAIRELASPGALMPDSVPAERVLRERIGPMDTTYASSGSNEVRVMVIENVLANLLKSPAGVMTKFVQRT
jgi:hypothetical protein